MGIIRKIKLRKGTTEKQLIEFSNWLEDKGKFLASGQNDDGSYYIVCRFDDELDYKAFLNFILLNCGFKNRK